MAEPSKITIKTRLPVGLIPPNLERAQIKTERLVIRPYTQDDLAGMHVLRTQPEVMHFTMRGCIDQNLAETQERLDWYLPPRDLESYNWAICLAETGEQVGMGGVNRLKANGQTGWPEVGYMFKREHWGKGYATEFLRAFLDAWWTLERSEVELEVDARSVDGIVDGAQAVAIPDRVTAIVDANNRGSLRVMEKAGFRQYKQFVEADSRMGYEGKDITLVGFIRSKET
ncbi:hypothetical protein JX266_012403 [Neoarthrinium moseri]|uniref:uncharacterized protein n=1 Tax=Neoarthrinium moseri TaxID=1658444 RepID=UPI001FDCFB23|nr:uncharacterized protein JN550_009817 [Neoarthrinium moseri]KAI1841392.1 hypothetical protein JX266_012403 [Neoarthrinium moseri]KAI1863081.1 hypothetical protein JN550_009817 [Neoarthrinium moseri]